MINAEQARENTNKALISVAHSLLDKISEVIETESNQGKDEVRIKEYFSKEESLVFEKNKEELCKNLKELGFKIENRETISRKNLCIIKW